MYSICKYVTADEKLKTPPLRLAFGKYVTINEMLFF